MFLKLIKNKAYLQKANTPISPFSISWKWSHLDLWENNKVTSHSQEFTSAHSKTLKQPLNISNIQEKFNMIKGEQTGNNFDEYLKRKAQEYIKKQQIHLKEQTNPTYSELKEHAQKLNLSVNEFFILCNEEIRQSKSIQTLEQRIHTYSEELRKEIEENKDVIAQILSKHIEIGAMSDGSLSSQVHKHLTHAANITGVLSNSGEGGVEHSRYNTIENPLIFQCASGRFGFDLRAIIESDEVQIKIAQGAKPGEGGHLPGSKVSARIATIRRARKGTTLISPQPQHDLYSIEDLYLLIHAIKSVKPGLIINVKLASEPEVAVTALGAVKAGADRITIAGNSGGTGAAKISSIFNTGMPWEWGIATTHQMLENYNLRNKIQLVASGGIVNGCDIVDAVLLGADKVEIGTSALVSLGCIMLRKCHSPRQVSVESFLQPLSQIAKEKGIDNRVLAQMVYDALAEAGYIDINTGAVSLLYQEMDENEKTKRLNQNDVFMENACADIAKLILENANGGCTVGINTQDPLYIKKYQGTVDKATDFLYMMGLSALKYMKEEYKKQSKLYTLRGKAKDYLETDGFFEDMNNLLGKIQMNEDNGYIDTLLQIPSQNDIQVINMIKEHHQKYQGIQQSEIPTLKIENLYLDESNISFGTAISGFCEEIKAEFPIEITLNEKSQVGPQNLGSFLRKNITLIIEGSCNDHVGKGNSGGRIIVKKKQQQKEEIDIIVGNSICYGATEGEIYIDGNAGSRAFVRNSGLNGVITGDVNDHCCEFMTRGNIIICGNVERNVAAGMTGGYLFIDSVKNQSFVQGMRLFDIQEDQEALSIFEKLLKNCLLYTNSKTVEAMLNDWEGTLQRFKFYNPYHLNGTIQKHYQSEKEFSEFKLFKEDSNIAANLSQIDNKRNFKLLFQGNCGSDLGSFLPQNVSIVYKQGNIGQFLGYQSKGTFIIEKNAYCKSRFPFMRSSAKVFSDSYEVFGRKAFFQFNGTAIVNKLTEDSCQELGENAKIVVLEEITQQQYTDLFGINSHPNSEIIVNQSVLQKNNQLRAINLTKQQEQWLEEQLKEMNKKNCNVKKFKRLITQQNQNENKRSPQSINLQKKLLKLQQACGWSIEQQNCIESIAVSSIEEMTYSMGDQLEFSNRFLNSEINNNFYSLFRQPFAQETRPPVDADTEGEFICTDIYIENSQSKYYKFTNPIISNKQLEFLKENLNFINVELRAQVCEVTVTNLGLKERIEERVQEIMKQIRAEIIVGNKKVIIFTHQADENKEDRMYIDSWLIISMVQQGLRRENLGKVDIILQTYEPIDPHALDVLMNFCGVKLVNPSLIEQSFEVVAQKYKDNRGATYSPEELWNNYKTGMLKALKRIIAKDGDVDLSTRVHAQTYTAIFLSKRLADYIKIQTFFSNQQLDLEFLGAVFQQRYMQTLEQDKFTELQKSHLFKSSKEINHVWDTKRLTSLQTMLEKKDFEAFNEFYSKGGKINIRKHLQKKSHTFSVAIIGAGPAGVETALQIVENYNDIDEIVLFDSYYAPGGKIIDAVAPDHPLTKNQIKNLSIFDQPKIKFVGNAHIDQKQMFQIYQQFSAVFLTHGAQERQLEENIRGRQYVKQAYEIVKWYNSKTDMNPINVKKANTSFYNTEIEHPECPFDLKQTRDLAIIGAGNVTIDIARIFLRNPDDQLLSNNITSYIYKQLSQSQVKNVTCIIRKGPKDVKFGIPELQELSFLCEQQMQFQLVASFDEDFSLKSPQEQQFYDYFSKYKKNIEEINYLKHNHEQKVFHFIFNEEIDPHQGFVQNHDNQIVAYFKSGNQLIADSFISSLGYQPYMPVSNLLQINPNGQTYIEIPQYQENYVIPNLYVGGQAKTGVGNIGHTKNDVRKLLKESFQLQILIKKPSVESFLQDHYYKQGAVSKEVLIQVMQTIQSHYTGKYITQTFIEKHIENFKRMQLQQIISQSQNSTLKQVSKSSSENQVPSVPKKIQLYENEQDTNPKNIEIAQTQKSLKELLNITKGDCESGSCGGCYIFTPDPIEKYENSEENVALTKGGLQNDSVPKNYKVILSCQHTPKDLPQLNITRLILNGSNRSSCGIGVHKATKPSVSFVQNAIYHLQDDVARGAGVNSYGDGAGLMLKIDWNFFLKHGGFKKEVIDKYNDFINKKIVGICAVFVKDLNDVQYIKAQLEKQGLAIIHQRKVPINQNKFILGEARKHPQCYQYFIIADQKSNLKIEKILEKIQLNPLSIVEEPSALASISTKYVCYKLASFSSEIGAFEDLDESKGYQTDSIFTHTRFATTTLQPCGKLTSAIKAHPHQNLIHNGEILTKKSIINYLVQNALLFKQNGILIDRNELLASSDSYVLQRYILCLKHVFFPKISIADIIHMITRSTRINSKLADYARAKGMPQVCGPCNLSIYDEINDEFVFFRDNSGFRPAICIKGLNQEDQNVQEIHIVSQQQSQNENDHVSLLQEGQIYIIKNDNQIYQYQPDFNKINRNFNIIEIK